MFDLRNKTPFAAAILPSLDRNGGDQLSVLVKATYQLPGPQRPLSISSEQVPVFMADVHHGDDPATSSLKYQSDASPTKPGTDVVLVGHAYAPRGHVTELDVALEVARLRKTVKVVGDRVWTRANGWIMSRPLPFEKMPLTYERCFGGWDRTHPDPARHAGDDRNPVGAGYAADDRPERMEGLRLPNLEDPQHPARDWMTRPPIAGFGFVGQSWMPRRVLAGTYDAAWKDQRAPLLPTDFDERYFNGAPSDLIATPHLRGGESVLVRGASLHGLLSFTLPTINLEISLSIRREIVNPAAVLDTVIIEPDAERVVLSWRATVPCARRLLHVEAVTVNAR